MIFAPLKMSKYEAVVLQLHVRLSFDSTIKYKVYKVHKVTYFR